MNLSHFQKPSRYINSEINSLKKDAEIKVALAFPDIYDVGMSHLGLKILYKIINDLPYASAERVFHPWLDMEKGLRHKGEMLSSLETEKPLKDFDILGFSLQYELSYTTVLNMLHLAGIPIRRENRAEEKWPLVIAGGPCTVNPMPMAPFIDAFLIGDAEEAIVEILDTYRIWEKEGDAKKESVLKALSQIKGMYVPSVHSSVKRRYIESLDNFPYPESPVVPYTQIVHDRVNIEVSRGCTMGCRFCQAGMIYRPLRERSPEKALSIAEKSLKNTGHEEVSFTSLSAGDYSCLLLLLKKFNTVFSDKKVSLSLPSLRVAAVNQDVLREIKSVRKTGFTIAPEAATKRLRNVINKDFTEEEYEQSLKVLFEEGWHNLKLYFMIGLPTETWEDIEAIPKMAFEALKIAKRLTGKYVNINITISPFVPKSHTPFQWCGQENMNEIKRKSDYLRDAFRKKRLNFKGHDEKMSLLEAVFARGDERLSDLIETAWFLGCRLDAWTEFFEFGKWVDAMEKTGIDATAYAEKRYAEDEPLPWDVIDIGVKKEYLYREYQKAISAEKTIDCRKTCHACGLECKESAEATLPPPSPPCQGGDKGEVQGEDRRGKTPGFPTSQPSPVRVRVEFSKTGKLRFLSHLEVVTAILRAMRRAGIPLRYSQGFHPLPKISFGPALGVGIAGVKEYFDVEINQAFDINYLKQNLNAVLPEGLQLRDIASISGQEPSLSGFISKYEYEIICPDLSAANKFLEKEKGEINIKPMVENISVVNEKTVRLILADQEEKKVRLGEVLPQIFGVPRENLDITRLSMYGPGRPVPGLENEWVTPLEITMQPGGSRLWPAKS